MKKELDHFNIGSSYGGNQDWFRTFMMRLGGCGAETACDSSLYFAIHKGVDKIYPFDADSLSRKDYVDFAHIMEKYLWPRLTGIHRLDIYINGYSKYLKDHEVEGISMNEFSGNEPYDKAAEILTEQINSGFPVPMLTLNHKNREMKDYVWHWFLLNGYESIENTGELLVKAVTYGKYRWLDFRKLWATGFENKGGMVLYEM